MNRRLRIFAAGKILILDDKKERPGVSFVRFTSASLSVVKVGDHSLFGKWSGAEVKRDGEEPLVMKESAIMGVVEGKASKSVKAA